MKLFVAAALLANALTPVAHVHYRAEAPLTTRKDPGATHAQSVRKKKHVEGQKAGSDVLLKRVPKKKPVLKRGDGDDGEEEDAESEAREEILEEHEAPTPVSDAVAFMLLGMVAFQISLFYLVNFPDEDIQQFTWWSLTQTISIFCAVTLWHSIKTTVEFLLKEEATDSPLGDGVPETTEVHLCILFISLFIFCQLVMGTLWRNRVSLTSFGIISAHTVGFSAVDAFGEIVQMHPWRDSWMAVVAGTSILGFILFVMLQATTRLRKHRSEQYCDTDEDKEMVTRYDDVCVEMENEFAGFVLGLMCTQAIIYSITGTMPPIEGFPFGKTMPEVKSLMGASGGAIITLMLFIIFIRKVYKDREVSPFMSRAIEIIEMTISMTIGWTLLFAGRWLFWVSTKDEGVGQGDLMSARMVQALAFSFVSFACIFVIDFLADRGALDTSALRSLMSAMGLLLGLAWEGAFGEAIEGIGRVFEDQPKTHIVIMDTLGLSLCAIVLPAWAMYVLPSSMDAAKGEMEEEETRTTDKTIVS